MPSITFADKVAGTSTPMTHLNANEIKEVVNAKANADDTRFDEIDTLSDALDALTDRALSNPAAAPIAPSLPIMRGDGTNDVDLVPMNSVIAQPRRFIFFDTVSGEVTGLQVTPGEVLDILEDEKAVVTVTGTGEFDFAVDDLTRAVLITPVGGNMTIDQVSGLRLGQRVVCFGKQDTSNRTLGLAGSSNAATIDAATLTMPSGSGALIVWELYGDRTGAGAVKPTFRRLQRTAAEQTALLAAASETAQGAVELATTAEVNTGTDAARAVHPDGLAASYAGTKEIAIEVFRADTSCAVGDGTQGIPVPESLNGMNIVNILVCVATKGVTGAMDVQIRRRRAGSNVDMLSTKVTVGDEWFAADGVINASNDDLATGDLIFVDIDAIHTTAALGCSVSIAARLP